MYPTGRLWLQDTTAAGVYGAPEALFCDLSPHQRTAIGFPPAGDPWFTEEILALVKLRLPEFDPAPYLALVSPPAIPTAS